MSTVLLLLGLATTVVGRLVAWVLEDQACSELRARHPGVWSAIGSPDKVFDDFGLARHYALERLRRDPQLMALCASGVLAHLRLNRIIGRASLVGGGIIIVIGLAYLLGAI